MLMAPLIYRENAARRLFPHEIVDETAEGHSDTINVSVPHINLKLDGHREVVYIVVPATEKFDGGRLARGLLDFRLARLGVRRGAALPPRPKQPREPARGLFCARRGRLESEARVFFVSRRRSGSSQQ